ncbi:MAG: AAA family ATPase [Saccharofermentanales bacterium]
MATSEHIKMLIRAFYEKNEEKFKTTILQIAAYEAKLGHTTFSRDLKDMYDKSNSTKNINILRMNNQNQMLSCIVPDNRLHDLVTSNEVKSRIERILDEFGQREKLRKHGLANRRKILIEGLPGTGKTLTASIIASELKLPLYTVQMDKLVTKYMGETSIKLRQIFDSISDIDGVYLFDEFDAIGADRSMDNEVGEMRRILNSFLQFIEQDSSDSIIIAATNNQKILDQALFRRFDDVIHYELPNKDEIKKLINIRMDGFLAKNQINSKVLEVATDLSHAEITRACEDTIKYAIIKNIKVNNELLTSMLKERRNVYFGKEA